jgi:hypothetical protein
MTANPVISEGNLVTKVVTNSAVSRIATSLFASRSLDRKRASP